jgi:hypothetical protein
MKNKKLAIFTLLFVLATQPTKPIISGNTTCDMVLLITSIITAAAGGYSIGLAQKDQNRQADLQKEKEISSELTRILDITKNNISKSGKINLLKELIPNLNTQSGKDAAADCLKFLHQQEPK